MPENPESALRTWWSRCQRSPQSESRFLAIEGQAPFANVLFSGSFNPLHPGHRAMAQLAAEILGRPVHFELSVVNADKPTLSPETILSRLSQDFATAAVWLTNAPTFLQKAKLFPETTFVVGADTLQRIADPRFYANCQPEEIWQTLARCGSRFLVFARHWQGETLTLEQLAISQTLRSLCQAVPVERFLIPISSRELRDRR